jgi:hypothetical protein
MTEQIYCGAKMASGLCKAPPAAGKRRCFRHGGAPGSGAPRGSQNALKHGFYTKKAIGDRRRLYQLLHELTHLAREL